MTDPAIGYPLLLLPKSGIQARESAGGGSGGRGYSRRPSASEQDSRLGAKWQALSSLIEQRSAQLAEEVAGADPELVLVFEIIGDIPDFYRAVARIEGFEYLAEIDEEDVDGENVFVAEGDAEALFDGTLFLLASNQVALSEVLQLWQQYIADENSSFPRNLGRWKELFRLLRDVRRWSPQDRLRGTGVLEDFARRQAVGDEIVSAEIEFWFRSDLTKRQQAQEIVGQLVNDAGGEVIASAVIEPISYHAILVHLPIGSVEPLLDSGDGEIALLRAEQIAFVRPEAQAAVRLANLENPEEAFSVGGKPGDFDPLIGILDGLPLAGHRLLEDRMVLDDPDDWSSSVQAKSRQHGTAITSLVLHGDGNYEDGVSLTYPVYVRPVLRPDDTGSREAMPHDTLPIDLIYNSVLRMLDENAGAVARSVKIINLSLGDSASQLALSISPWARLLDWLSYRYRVLFVISAGNHVRPIQYELTWPEFQALSPEELKKQSIEALVSESSRRRILSPSESVNSICVGASHDDGSKTWVEGSRRDILTDTSANVGVPVSPISSFGMGYRRSIKPDILAPGGRVLFRCIPSGNGQPGVVAKPLVSDLAPGLKVASPASRAGALDATRHFHGTSGSAALISHWCGLFLEYLDRIDASPGVDKPDDDHLAVIAKTMIVHASSLPIAELDVVRDAFGDLSSERMKDAITRIFGYGVLSPDRLMGCTSSRATLLGWGSLQAEDSDLYEIPLPPSLSGVTVERRLTITTAYFSPIRTRDRRHRAAQIFIKPRQGALAVNRTEADWRTVKRGTVQHEILGGSRAAAFVDGDNLIVQVNCRSTAGSSKDVVPYGLAVTIEVPETVGLPIYEQIAARVRARIRPQV